MRALAEAVQRRREGPVEAAFLDFNSPAIPAALRAASAGGEVPIVVPALLTSAYHGRVDLPEVLRATGLATRVTPVLGPAEPGDLPHSLLLGALIRRLAKLPQLPSTESPEGSPSSEGREGPEGPEGSDGSEVDSRFDGIVLIAAGTSHASARSTVERIASALGEWFDVPCRVGYASASAPTGAEAVAQVRAAGAARIVAASYFLAAGRLYDAAAASARSAGALGVAEPIGAADELVELVLERVSAVTS
jgi:sirohydrochlorin ferrochelatase